MPHIARTRHPRDTPPMPPTPNLDALAADARDALAAAGDEDCVEAWRVASVRVLDWRRRA